MNIGELKNMLTDFNDDVEVVLMDRNGRVYEIDFAKTDNANNNPCGGYFEATNTVGLLAGKNIPRTMFD